MVDGSLGITINPLSRALGAEVSGFGSSALDLTDLDDETFEGIHEAFLEHQLLVFHNQRLSHEDFLAVARRFGVPIRHPFATGHEAHPEITTIVKEPDEVENFGGMWHSDLTYLARPPKAALMMAVETPRVGGDTLFACQHRACESLSDGLRSFLSRLHAVSSSAKNADRLLGTYYGRAYHGDADDGGSDDGDSDEGDAHDGDADHGSLGEPGSKPHIAIHPAIRRHPETGRAALFVNRAHTVTFDELTAAESAPILGYLFSHQTRPEFTARVRWAPGTVAIWDNRSLLHFAINDYGGRRREMWRATLEGDTPEPA